MTGRTRRFTRALAAAAVAGIALGAQASPGNGIRLGGSEARLHPFLDLETRYDSNVAYSPSNQALGDLILHVRPGLELKAPGDLAALEFTAAFDWAQYLGIEGDTSGLSRLYPSAALAAVFNRRGTVSPRVDNEFRRVVSSSSLAAASQAVISNANTLTLSVPWKPGGGALVVAASAQWIVEAFEEYRGTSPVDLGDLGYNQYRAGGEVQWRFLPRTSALLQGGYYLRQPNGSAQGDATGWDVHAGLTGLLTQRLSATAKLGYGSVSVAASPTLTALDTGRLVAELGTQWLPLDTVSVDAGYTRSLGVDPTVSTYVADGVSGGVRVKLAERYAARLGARWDRMEFTAKAVSGASTSFLRVDPSVDALFGRWLSAGIGYVYSMRVAEWPTALGGAPPDYQKHEVFAKVGLTY